MSEVVTVTARRDGDRNLAMRIPLDRFTEVLSALVAAVPNDAEWQVVPTASLRKALDPA